VEEENDLHLFKNLGAASINILNAVGIRNQAELRRLGSVQTYLKIQHRGIQVSKVMLYALEGALMDVHWKGLDPIIKDKLLAEVEALAKNLV